LKKRGKDIAAPLGRQQGQRRAIVSSQPATIGAGAVQTGFSCAAYLGAETTCKFFCASGAAAATVELRALLDRERQVMDVALDAG
jgi:hypothetical protein